MNSSVINEWIKIRRSRVIWLFIFVPVVTCFLLTLALGYYLQKGHSPEQGWGLILSLTSRYLWQIIAFTVPVFIAYIVNMEQFSNMWKFLFAMPLAKWKIYVAKFFWGFATTLVMGLLFVFGIYIMAELHDVEHLVTIGQLFSYVYAPFLLAIPFVAFQLCVSMASCRFHLESPQLFLPLFLKDGVGGHRGDFGLRSSPLRLCRFRLCPLGKRVHCLTGKSSCYLFCLAPSGC